MEADDAKPQAGGQLTLARQLDTVDRMLAQPGLRRQDVQGHLKAMLAGVAYLACPLPCPIYRTAPVFPQGTCKNW